MKKEFKIIGVHTAGMGLICLHLMGKIPVLPINENDMTEEQRIGLRLSRGILQGMMQMEGLHPSTINYPTVLLLTKEEYEGIGTPTVEQELEIEIPPVKVTKREDEPLEE